jgi:hypothetical protein
MPKSFAANSYKTYHQIVTKKYQIDFLTKKRVYDAISSIFFKIKTATTIKN